MSAATDATNDEAAVNNPTQQQQASKKSNKKRKRTKQSPDELYQLESTDKYNKLHHACWKHLHREAKVVKSFECQKIVRSIKAITASSDALNDSDDVVATGADTNANATSDDNSREDAECATTKNKKKKNAASKAQKRVQTLQEKLDKTKNMDLNVLVQVGLKRLGVLALDPRSDDENENTVTVSSGSGSNKPKKWKKKSQQQQQQQQQYQQQQQTKSKDAETEMTSSSQSEDPFYQSLMETMLRHKRLSAALDQLNVKVADYRQWAIRRRGQLFNNGEDDFLMEDDGGGGAAAGKKKKKKNKGVANGNDTMVVAGGYNTRKRGLDLGGHEGESGLFIGSLSGSMAMVGGFGDDDEDEYGEEGDNEYGHQEQEEKKKNRPGQRARRAKAMAIEAKKAGRTWGASTNWREKKERDPDAGYGDEYKQHRADSSRGHHVKSSRNHDDQQHNKSNNKQGRGRHEGSNEDGAPSTGKPKEAIASMGKAWKEEGNAHPSWAAAAAKKAEGIKEFQGTKITFD